MVNASLAQAAHSTDKETAVSLNISAEQLMDRLNRSAGRLDSIIMKANGNGDSNPSVCAPVPSIYGAVPCLRSAHEHADRIERMLDLLTEVMG